MTVITQNIADIAGASDGTAWVFYTPQIREASDGGIVSTKKVRKYPADGVLTVELDPGPAVVIAADGKHYPFIVPDEDTELWPLIQAAVEIPPTTTQEKLAAAVAAWLQNNQDPFDAAAAAWLTENPPDPGPGVDSVTLDGTELVASVQGVEVGRPDLGPVVTEAAETASEAVVADIRAAVKTGDPWWNKVLTPPADNPTITAAISSQISGGTTLTPTADYDYDPYFRYDGCVSVMTQAGGVKSVNGSPEFLVPEIVTDRQDIEFKFRSGRTGDDVIGVRAVVDGKLSSVFLQRFDATTGTDYFYRLHFTEEKVRHIKFEINGHTIFLGAVLGPGSVAQRPKGPHRFRHIAIGDSLTAGGPNMHIGAETDDDIFYMNYETHSYYQSVAMGCDSYINLGAGGTGWGDNVPGDTFAARIPRALSGHPHVLGFYGSRNDAGYESIVTARVMDGLAQCEDVPIVLVSGPQQALSTTVINEAVRQGVVAAGRTWLDVQGAAAGPSSNPTHHPTLAEQLNIAKVAHAQVDMTRVLARVEGINAARQPVSISLATSPASPVTTGASVTLTATLVGSATALVGKVQFYDGVTKLGSAQTVTAGSAAVTTSALTAGTHNLTARFLPADPSSVKAATSNTVAFTVSANLGVLDTFTRADGAVGSTENGKTWDTSLAPLATISGNMLSNPTANVNVEWIAADCGTPWGIYEYTVGGTYGTDVRFGFFFQDANNHVYVSAGGGSGKWTLATRITSTLTTVTTADASTATWAPGDVIRVETTHGSTSTRANIVLKKNGTTVITANDVELGAVASYTKVAWAVKASTNAAKLDKIEMVAAA